MKKILILVLLVIGVTIVQMKTAKGDEQGDPEQGGTAVDENCREMGACISSDDVINDNDHQEIVIMRQEEVDAVDNNAESTKNSTTSESGR